MAKVRPGGTTGTNRLSQRIKRNRAVGSQTGIRDGNNTDHYKVSTSSEKGETGEKRTPAGTNG